MLLTTRSIGGCWACKRMKLKCGEEKPNCLRCTRAYRECPGYPATPDKFRHATVSSGKLTWSVNQQSSHPSADSRRSGQRNTIQNSALEGQTTDVAPNLHLDRRYCPLSPSVSIDWEQFALKHFLYFHTIPWQPGSVYGGYMSFLEDFCQDDTRPPYLHDALHATALVSISHLAESKRPLVKAMSYRSKALTALWPVLSDETEASTDEALTTFFLLERFEAGDLHVVSRVVSYLHSNQLITGENQTSKVWFNHSLGMSALLRLRGPSQVETDIGSELFRSINFQLVAKDLGYGSNLSHPGCGTHARYTPTSLHQSHVAQCLVGLRREFRKAVDGTSRIAGNNLILGSIFTKAIELEKLFDAWPELTLPEVRLSCTAAPSTLLQDTFNFFPTLQDAIAWNFFWFFRLRVFRIELDCLKPVGTCIDLEPSDGELGLIQAITECADQICNTFPFLIGEVDEQGIHRPKSPLRVRGGFYGCMSGMAGLNTIITTPELDRTRPQMRPWAFAQLYQVSDRLGLKQMSEFARFYQARIRAKANVRNLILETVD